MRPDGIARPAHPWAWWGWALGIAGAVSLSLNPLLSLLIALGMVAVVLLRRSDAPWARSLGAYFVLAGFVLGVRLLFQILMGAGVGSTVLFTLPSVPLPSWAAGIRLGGAVTAEPLAYTLNDALRLAVMIVVLGAANALANPRRALRSVPAALYEASVALVIALSVAPQLVASAQRIRQARRLRGDRHALASLVIPVLADAVDASINLAASMESRGFGRTRDASRTPRGLTALLLVSIAALAFGGFWLISGSSPLDRLLAGAALALGLAGTVLGLRLSGRRLAATRYRPDPWTPRDTLMVAAGVVALVVAAVVSSTLFPDAYNAFNPSTDPLVWPELHPAMAPIVAATLAPLALTTDPRRPA